MSKLPSAVNLKSVTCNGKSQHRTPIKQKTRKICHRNRNVVKSVGSIYSSGMVQGINGIGTGMKMFSENITFFDRGKCEVVRVAFKRFHEAQQK